MLKDLCFAAMFVLIGAVMGALLLARTWVKQMQKPVVAKKFLQDLFKTVNPTLKQCPTCGCCGDKVFDAIHEYGKEPNHDAP